MARALGIHPTSLYTYVATKDELLRAMLDHVITGQLQLPDVDDPRDPVEQLTQIWTDATCLMAGHVELVGFAGELCMSGTLHIEALKFPGSADALM